MNLREFYEKYESKYGHIKGTDVWYDGLSSMTDDVRLLCIKYLDDIYNLAINDVGKLNTAFGICFQLDVRLAKRDIIYGYDIVSVFSTGWKHHNGTPWNPVPDTNNHGIMLWFGEPLEYRLDLICYLKQQLEQLTFEE